MKKRLKLPLFVAMSSLIVSCGSEQEASLTDEVNSKKEVITINTTKVFNLNAENSEVTWDRYLHQGPTKKTIKIFGADAEVELGEVELNTTGGLSLTSGSLSDYNDSIIGLNLYFDMTTFKLNTDMEKGDDLFKAKEYGSSELRVSEIKKDSTGYILIGELEIAGVANPITANAEIVDVENGKNVKANFVIQTLDWPLRDESAKKSVIKDEVSIKLDMLFENGEVVKDTIVTYE